MPPKVGTKGAKKAVTKAKTARAGGDKKRRRRRRESYAIYIYITFIHMGLIYIIPIFECGNT
jgi:hypothetical protein